MRVEYRAEPARPATRQPQSHAIDGWHTASKGADIKKPRENPGFDGSRWLPNSNEMTPTGIEPVLPP